MSNKQGDYDELSALIDSMENDDTMEKKIDDFKKNHQKKRTRKYKYSNHQVKNEKNVDTTRTTQPMKRALKPKGDMGKTRVIQPEMDPVDSGAAKTTVFDPDTIDDALTGSNETVVLDDDQIHNIIEKDETSRQQEVEKDESEQSKRRPRLSRNQIISVIVGVACVLVVVMGVVNYINTNGDLRADQTTENTADYQSLLSWAKKYDSLSKSKKQDITEYEDIYNDCTREQQKEIDRILKKASGKNFNQLLAQAKSSKKKSSKNNNVKSAEKKAKLKRQLSSLESQLSDAQTNLTNINNAISTLQDQIDQTNQKINDKDNAVTKAQTDLTNAQKQLTEAQSKNSDSDNDDDNNSNEVKSAQEAVDKAQEAYDKAVKDNDTSSLQNDLNRYNSQLSDYQNQQAQAQAQIDSLNAQISDLNYRISKLS